MPEVLEPIWRKLSVPHRMLDVLVAQVRLQRPRIVALVRKRKAVSMAQHMRMSLEAELRLCRPPAQCQRW